MSFQSRRIITGVGIVTLPVLFLLALDSRAGEKRMVQLNEDGMRPAPTVADCTYTIHPQKFLQASPLRRKALSRTTALVASKIGAQPQPTPAHVTVRGEIERKNFIDDFIFDKMAEDEIPHSDLSTDEEFLRRVTLDLTGRIPTASEVRQFLADTGAGKRAAKIETLLSSPSFVDRWTMFFGDLLKNTAFSSNVVRYNEGRNAFYNYIKASIQENKPYNLFAKEIIGGSGDNWVDGEVNFVVGGRTPMGPAQDTYDTLTVRTTTVFLGINSFDCLLCHSGVGHLEALSLWGSRAVRMDGWKMSAFFSRTQSRREQISERPRRFKYHVSDRNRGEYRLNTDSGNRTARRPVGDQGFVRPEYIFSHTQFSGSTYRTALAEMMTADFQFARAAVNYLWAEMMGLGIVDPPDGFDLARLDPENPPPAPWDLQPTHPRLLTQLADEFIRSHFDLRHMLGLIAGSSTYQLSAQWNGTWDDAYIPYFARKFVRRLDAEEIHDAISQASGILPDFQVGGIRGVFHRAMQLPDTSEPRGRRFRTSADFLNAFLRGDRDTVERSSEGSIMQALNLMNSPFINTRIHNGNRDSLVNFLIAQKKSDEEVVEELYLATLSRFPTDAEESQSVSRLASAPQRGRAVEDLQWTLMNKVDFIFNY